MSEPTIQMFSIEVCAHRQWGGPQQVSLDRLLYASGPLAPEAAAHLLAEIKTVVKDVLEFAPLSEGSWKALESIQDSKFKSQNSEGAKG